LSPAQGVGLAGHGRFPSRSEHGALQLGRTAIRLRRAVGAQLRDVFGSQISEGAERLRQTFGAAHLAAETAKPQHDGIAVVLGVPDARDLRKKRRHRIVPADHDGEAGLPARDLSAAHDDLLILGWKSSGSPER